MVVVRYSVIALCPFLVVVGHSVIPLCTEMHWFLRVSSEMLRKHGFRGGFGPVGRVLEGLGGPKRSLVPVEPKVVPDEVLDAENEGLESPGPS